MDRATSLRDLVAAGALKAPVQLGFSQAAWEVALHSLASPTEDDRRLHRAAIFFGQQLEGLRARLATVPTGGESVDAKVRRAVGFVNREYLTVLENSRERRRPQNVWATDLVQEELELAGGINAATPDDVVETLVDGLRFELAALSGETAASVALPPGEELRRIADRVNLSVFYEVLEGQWYDCLHHGWDVHESQGVSWVLPADRESAISWAVGQYRESLLAMEILTGVGDLLRKDRRFADGPLRRGISRTGSGKHKRYAVGEMSRQLSDELTACRCVAAEPDLDPFALAPLPKIGGLTPVQLLDVWTALVPLAEQRAERMPTAENINNVAQLEQFAPAEEMRPLLLAVRKCTRLSLAQCGAAIAALTWRNHRDSLWTRPFVSLRNGSYFAMVLPAFRSPNLRRSIEYWLTIGGSDLGARGEPFEQLIRDEAADAIDANSAIREAAGAVRGRTVPDDPTIGDIDLLVWLGRSVLVGETKCLLRPGTAHERRQYEERIREGAAQVVRKAAYVKAHPEWLRALDPRLASVAAASFDVVPCVIINSAIGALRSVADVPIVDRYVVDRYLRGFAERRESLDAASFVKVCFYSDAAEAGRRLGDYLKRPTHLEPYRDSTVWAERVQPDFRNRAPHVKCKFPVVRVSAPAGRESQSTAQFDAAPPEQ